MRNEVQYDCAESRLIGCPRPETLVKGVWGQGRKPPPDSPQLDRGTKRKEGATHLVLREMLVFRKRSMGNGGHVGETMSVSSVVGFSLG